MNVNPATTLILEEWVCTPTLLPLYLNISIIIPKPI